MNIIIIKFYWCSQKTSQKVKIRLRESNLLKLKCLTDQGLPESPLWERRQALRILYSRGWQARLWVLIRMQAYLPLERLFVRQQQFNKKGYKEDSHPDKRAKYMYSHRPYPQHSRARNNSHKPNLVSKSPSNQNKIKLKTLKAMM